MILNKKALEDAAKCDGCHECSIAAKCSEGTTQIDIAQTALAYRSMLERLEWRDIEYVNDTVLHRCPICGGYQSGNHFPECQLAALLKEE